MWGVEPDWKQFVLWIPLSPTETPKPPETFEIEEKNWWKLAVLIRIIGGSPLSMDSYSSGETVETAQTTWNWG